MTTPSPFKNHTMAPGRAGEETVVEVADRSGRAVTLRKPINRHRIVKKDGPMPVWRCAIPDRTYSTGTATFRQLSCSSQEDLEPEYGSWPQYHRLKTFASTQIRHRKQLAPWLERPYPSPPQCRSCATFHGIICSSRYILKVSIGNVAVERDRH
jgi:hypothetical protein